MVFLTGELHHFLIYRCLFQLIRGANQYVIQATNSPVFDLLSTNI
jgi:hypothetical protein